MQAIGLIIDRPKLCPTGLHTCLLQDVCHLWELGGGTMYTNLIETPLVAPQLPDTTVLIIIDLSRPELIWSTLTSLLVSVKEYVRCRSRSL